MDFETLDKQMRRFEHAFVGHTGKPIPTPSLSTSWSTGRSMTPKVWLEQNMSIYCMRMILTKDNKIIDYQHPSSPVPQ